MKPVCRKCRYCEQEWNVSRLDPGGKVYICPKCEWQRKKREENKK